jgi:transcriptional regulatory protein RtcR
MTHKKKVVIGFLGPTKDAGFADKRWERWRPTLSVFGHKDFAVDQLDLLLTGSEHNKLCNQVVTDIASKSDETDVRVHTLDISNPWNFQDVYACLHEFAKNYDFREDCDYYVHLTTGTHVAQICLFLLTESRHIPARLLQTSMKKSNETSSEDWQGEIDVIDLDLSTYDQLTKRLQSESADGQEYLKGGITTRNKAFNDLIRRIERVALKSSAPILLGGPTGAGKSLLAKRIFELRSRRHLVTGNLVEVNCATLRGDNAMSSLFGHKKGAFTGAISDRPGFLKTADKGTLFLDEIGELGLDEQAMLLRALEDKRFTPMGSDKEVGSDFQLLAGTNKDLAKEVQSGRFRADLLARLNVWHFTLPGLAQRLEDIEPNLDFEMERASKELGRRISMTKEARETFMGFAMTAPWTGNFRDLASTVMRMSTLCEAGRISAEDVRMECESLKSSWGFGSEGEKSTSTENLPRDRASLLIDGAIDAFDRAQIEAVLLAIKTTDSMAAAGRQLFGASRLSKDKPNDSDRVRKFLTRWNLDYATVKRKIS